MLNEIICEKFNKKNQTITFHSGLNVILGDDSGTNSIGKSTFLMIIDFVFGGDDYIEKCTDVHRNVGFHQIKYSFTFDTKPYKFIRDTQNPNIVYKCDENYEIQEEESIQNYRVFLKYKYKISNEDLSFRDAVSGYYRIYQRKNYNEYKPFQAFEGEGGEKSIIRLIKLYDLYESIKIYEELDKENSEKLSLYKKSINQGFLPKVTKRKYEYDKKEIEETEAELTSIATDLDKDIFDIENLRTSEFLKIKEQLTLVRAKLLRYKNRQKRLQFELSENISPTISNSDFYDSLKLFFPSVNTKKLSDVDEFHKGIYRILNKEVKFEIKELELLINKCNEEVAELLQQLEFYQDEKKVSKVVLKKIETAVSHKKELIAETSNYDKLQLLIDSKKQSSKRLENEMQNILLQLQNRINSELAVINLSIYTNAHQAPLLSLRQKNYEYSSIDDNGTGTNYKNLIIMDICLLKQSCLPCLIHDSLLFKNIADEPLENLFTLYTTLNKQVFIAFDRLSTYSEKIQTILENHKVLKLSDGTQSLFGFTWSVKQ